MSVFADILIRQRWLVLALITVVTLLFAWQIKNIRLETNFSDLLPTGHPYVETHLEYQAQYGSPLTVFVLVQAKGRDIYNSETLAKIKRITRAFDFLPGVNHDLVYSIASRRVKRIEVVGDEISSTNLMPDEVPETPEELAAFRDHVHEANGVMGIWVSMDETAALVAANCIEHAVDYRQLLGEMQRIQSEEQDAGHEIRLAGAPILIGHVYAYQNEVLGIFLATIALLFATLYLYLRDLRLTLLPIIATLVSGVWGLGFIGLMGYTLNPLVLVLPVLIMARTLSHSVQKVERYLELEERTESAENKARALARMLFASGMLGILTDAAGILVIAIANIPLLQKLAVFCSFWAVSTIVTVLLLIPVLVAIIPLRPSDLAHVRRRLEHGFAEHILVRLAWLAHGRPAWGVVAVFGAVTIASIWIAGHITIGDAHPGTPLLWPSSPYNRAVEAINSSFVGTTDELYIIIEGDGPRSIPQPAVLDEMWGLQRHLEAHPMVSASISFADFLSPLKRLLNGNHPKWDTLPTTGREAGQYVHMLLSRSFPGDFAKYISNEHDNANVIVWTRDHRGETVRSVLEHVEGYLDTQQANGVRFRLASGNIGIVAAVNDVVATRNLTILLCALVLVGIACMIAYRSFWAAIVLMVPLLATNFVVMAIMVMMNIGLDVNTLPIASVGMGIGIDYGIYLLTRLCQEYRQTPDYAVATPRTIHTTGRAIFFTATTMVLGVMIWYFLSSFRFQAEMGLLLALVMAINMIFALLVIPSLLYVFRPSFVTNARLLEGE